MASLSDPKHVQQQYRDSSRFDARVRMYELFAQRDGDFYGWISERLDFGPDARVLEVGTGTANLWRGKIRSEHLFLSDRSLRMLETGRNRLRDTGAHAHYACLDVQTLPFPSATFDVVIANHMLYHVPDRDLALSEIHRVLVPGGRLYSTTNGWSHLIEMRELTRRFGLKSAAYAGVAASGWDLEDAARAIGARFVDLGVESYRDALHVTDSGPLIDAIRSIGGDDPSDAPALEELRRHVDWIIGLEGWFHIGTWAGLVSGRR